MKLDIIGFGALNFDKLYKVKKIANEGEHAPIESVFESPGGSAANTIIALGKLNLKTGFIGAVGEDTEGKKILENFRKFNVDTNGIISLREKKTGIVIGFVDKKGERTLYPYPGANNFLSRKNISFVYIKKSNFLHLSSFVDKKQFNLQKFVVKKVYPKVRISFSPGDLYSKKGLEELLPIIRRSEILFLNSSETKILTGKNYIQGAKILNEKGAKIVVITLGKNGCYIRTEDFSVSLPAFKTKVVDTTGAGDAFAAGFLYGFLREQTLEKCGKIGNFLASKCIEKFGAIEGVPTKEEFEKFFPES